MANQKITDKPLVNLMSDTDSIVGVFGGKTGRMTMKDFRQHLNDNEQQVLEDLAFYIDINSPFAKGSTYVDVGGNLEMRNTVFGMRQQALMDANGNYCPLNPNDGRYLETGEAIVDIESGAILDKWKNCDIMLIIPKIYGYIQEVSNGVTTKLLPWYSALPIPGGYEIPQQVVGVFKASQPTSNGAIRSLPNYTPAASITMETFWDKAQLRSKNHGLAGVDFRVWLLIYMMGMYGQRDCQNAKTSDGTLIWGVGLDGSESKGSDKFANQKVIKTGVCLSLGINDGKAAVADSDGTTVHSVNVGGAHDPWGQYWEFCPGLCSVGDDVYVWKSNVVPHVSKPTADTFANIPHVIVKRKLSSGHSNKLHILQGDNKGVVPIPQQTTASGILYGDYYGYGAEGQSWLFGGYSNHGSGCGLAFAYSTYAWRGSYSYVSARLAYYGDIKQVTASELARLAAA